MAVLCFIQRSAMAWVIMSQHHIAANARQRSVITSRLASAQRIEVFAAWLTFSLSWLSGDLRAICGAVSCGIAPRALSALVGTEITEPFHDSHSSQPEASGLLVVHISRARQQRSVKAFLRAQARCWPGMHGALHARNAFLCSVHRWDVRGVKSVSQEVM